MKTKEQERIEGNISLLGDKLGEFLYATDYFGLPDECADNESIKKILQLAHQLSDEILKGDYLD